MKILPNTTRSFKDQLPRNLVANLVFFLINVVIGLLLVPYFINTLGIAAYGLIPLATSITGYVAIIITSINTSVARFLTVDLQREEYAAANRTFNTAFFGISAIILIMVPVIIVFSVFIPFFFQVPSGQESGVIILFLGVFTAFLIRSWSGNFTVQLFAYNRLDLQNLVNIIHVIVQTVLIILFFTIFSPNLAFIGGAYLIGAIVASVVSIIFAKRICPFIKISVNSFDRTRVNDLCGMGWWVVINQIGALLFLQIDLIVVNIFFGAISAGEYAIALQWMILLRAISGVLSAILTPIVLTYYARDQIKSLIRISKSAVKLMGLAMALPIGLICGFAPELLTVWVGPQFTSISPLMWIMLLPLVINLAVLPLFSINVAFNRVRIPGIVLFIMGCANIVLAIILALFSGWGYYGVAIAGAITLTLTNSVFTPWYTARILKKSIMTFVSSIIIGFFAMVCIIGMTMLFSILFDISKLQTLAISILIISGIYLFILIRIGLNCFERSIAISCLPKNLQIFIKKKDSIK